MQSNLCTIPGPWSWHTLLTLLTYNCSFHELKQWQHLCKFVFCFVWLHPEVCEKDGYHMTWAVKLVQQICKVFSTAPEKFCFIQQLENMFSEVTREFFEFSVAGEVGQPMGCKFRFMKFFSLDTKNSFWKIHIVNTHTQLNTHSVYREKAFKCIWSMCEHGRVVVGKMILPSVWSNLFRKCVCWWVAVHVCDSSDRWIYLFFLILLKVFSARVDMFSSQFHHLEQTLVCWPLILSLL